jgi:hypothetical protein
LFFGVAPGSVRRLLKLFDLLLAMLKPERLARVRSLLGFGDLALTWNSLAETAFGPPICPCHSRIAYNSIRPTFPGATISGRENAAFSNGKRGKKPAFD